MRGLDETHLPRDYELEPGYTISYFGYQSKYSLVDPVGNTIDIGLAQIYTDEYRGILREGFDNRYPPDGDDLGSCLDCGGRLRQSMGLKPGFEGDHILNCIGDDTQEECGWMLIPDQFRVSGDQLQRAIAVRQRALIARIEEIIRDNKENDGRGRPTFRLGSAPTVATAPNSPQTPSRALAGFGALGLATPQSRRKAFQKQLMTALIPPEWANVADKLLAVKREGAARREGAPAPSASAPAPSTFAPAGSTPATSPAPAVVAKTEMSAADVSKVGSGLVRGRKRTRREVPTVGLPVGPTKAAQEAQKKKKPLPPLDVPLENKFTVDAAGEMCALSMPVAWRDELMRKTEMAIEWAFAEFCVHTQDHPIEFSDDEEDGRPSKKPRVAIYPLRVVMFLKNEINVIEVPHVPTDGLFVKDLGPVTGGVAHFTANDLMYLDTVQRLWMPFNKEDAISLAPGSHTLIVVCEYAHFQVFHLASEIFNVLAGRLPSECRPLDDATA
ncbi:hypothetical protein EIP86_001647 [Pleurotus ostreatoroseus]|nr:hypothetical protein EIP86_001647 [Pleurotus ostreatoroseus]